MSAFQGLKKEIRVLEKVFHAKHERFRVKANGLDELSCHFLGANGEQFVIHCNIYESYPCVVPMWFTESDENSVVDSVEKIGGEQHGNVEKLLTKMTSHLIEELCKKQDLEVPEVVRGLENIEVEEENDCNEEMSKDEDDEEEILYEEEDTEEYDNYEMGEENNSQKKSEELNGISKENFAVLEKLRLNQRDEHLKGTVSGSVQASDRLMKELREVYRSDSFKKGLYHVTLNNDSLYDWIIEILKVDPDSSLHKDLIQLKNKGGKGNITLNMTFTDKFPFEPPFVRVICPVLNAGYVLSGGALCMELLTTQGWSSAYSIESVIVQISATLVKGKARINFKENDKPDSYNMARAQQSFRSLVQIHERNGWFTPPKDEG
ncbi:ubiquitin-conjugating enzyme E2 Q2-like [Dendronephthya gigantea]|uniref:ubiquitin-conjugating enzyme E2 Q2-like n=1 Tax=Dendronephthya gigantea TaxID=151771 RepID=UPI00106CAA53|nr:ubiquitin-conjugating enzyme E2 Q2-like [Dendronephthya gigantea]